MILLPPLTQKRLLEKLSWAFCTVYTLRKNAYDNTCKIDKRLCRQRPWV